MKNYRVRVAVTSWPVSSKVSEMRRFEREGAVVVEVVAPDETAAVGRVGALLTRLLREEDGADPEPGG